MTHGESDFSNQWPSERAFLHALSTPLSTLGLVLDSLEESLKNSEKFAENHEAREETKQMRQIIERVFRMIQERRTQLP